MSSSEPPVRPVQSIAPAKAARSKVEPRREQEQEREEAREQELERERERDGESVAIQTGDIVFSGDASRRYLIVGIDADPANPGKIVVNAFPLIDEMAFLSFETVRLADNSEWERRRQLEKKIQLEQAQAESASMAGTSDVKGAVDDRSPLSDTDLEPLSDELMAAYDLASQESRIDVDNLMTIKQRLVVFKEDYQSDLAVGRLLGEAIEYIQQITDMSLDEDDLPPESGFYDIRDAEAVQNVLNDLSRAQDGLEQAMDIMINFVDSF